MMTYIEILAQNVSLKARAAELEALLNTPELVDFAKGVVIEAAHQRERWPEGHDTGKSFSDWIRLCVHLLGKLSKADWERDLEKVRHHQITLAAVLANFHAAAMTAGTYEFPQWAKEPWTISEETKAHMDTIAEQQQKAGT